MEEILEAYLINSLQAPGRTRRHGLFLNQFSSFELVIMRGVYRITRIDNFLDYLIGRGEKVLSRFK